MILIVIVFLKVSHYLFTRLLLYFIYIYIYISYPPFILSMSCHYFVYTRSCKYFYNLRDPNIYDPYGFFLGFLATLHPCIFCILVFLFFLW